ncbi:hypothetical protein [Pontibacter sp. HSC-36F09]|uniref:hypothetical protein n=1 Tax=Pontibacter sp. HSC-36F09 TaxID=2910966 RepID=UPI0020A03C40|nr:hypothetical protein [Pontibacter sp. HSC-36F09]MCP2044217.1 hypothetical protein [Pontibacter sp. HSC-36F09]
MRCFIPKILQDNFQIMILLQNSILRLEYDPATDILQVRYPDLQRYHMSEIKHSLQIMVQTIRNYDVRKLLLDARTTSIEIDDEENRRLTMEFTAMLSATRLSKVARLQPFDPKNGTRAQRNIEEARKTGAISYEVATFATPVAALDWLKV